MMSDTTTDLPIVFDYAGADAGTPLDALDELQAGDRVLWDDRTQPCTVARVVEPGDRVGQALTASVIRISDAEREAQAQSEYEDYWIENGDVFVDPRSWGRLTGKRFAVIQGPRGGFYAIAEPEDSRKYPALFRAVRSFHTTNHGQAGKGAWKYETDFDGRLRVVDHGDEPDELDPVGDLPAYDDIKGNRVIAYDIDASEHYVVADTLDEAFDIGLGEAHKRAEERFAGDDSDDAPDASGFEPERVDGTPDGVCHATATVTEIVDTQYGKKGVIEAPPPWEMPDDAEPINEVIKSLPWESCHYEFDSDRKAWLVDADELTKVASVLRESGFAVRAEYDLDAIAA